MQKNQTKSVCVVPQNFKNGESYILFKLIGQELYILGNNFHVTCECFQTRGIGYQRWKLLEKGRYVPFPFQFDISRCKFQQFGKDDLLHF